MKERECTRAIIPETININGVEYITAELLKQSNRQCRIIKIIDGVVQRQRPSLYTVDQLAVLISGTSEQIQQQFGKTATQVYGMRHHARQRCRTDITLHNDLARILGAHWKDYL